MTTSDSAARWRIRVMKQSWNRGQSEPTQFSVVAAISGQKPASSGSVSSSARSPLSVRWTHPEIASTSPGSTKAIAIGFSRKASKRWRQR
jgi:hypothetical protein